MTSKFLPGALAALLACGGAAAQSAGSFVVHAGGAQFSPQANSGDLGAPSLTGTRIDMKKASGFAGGVTYFWTDRLSVDIAIAAPARHDLVGAGAIEGVGKLGSVKSMPITLLAQHRFGDAGDSLRPFIGAGPTYLHFSRPRATTALSGITGGTAATPTTLSMKSRLGATVEVGAAYNVTKDWSASVAVGKTFVKTKGTLSTGQSFEASLDPVSIRLGIGYRF